MRTVDFRIVASGLLTFVCALFMTLIAFGNITDFGTNRPSSRACSRWTPPSTIPT